MQCDAPPQTGEASDKKHAKADAVEPCQVLADATGIHESVRPRMLVGNIAQLKEVATIKFGTETLTATAARGKLVDSGGEVWASFSDGKPAVVAKHVGRGTAAHFAWLPGISYFRSATNCNDKLPTGFFRPLRDLITRPVRDAGVRMPVTCDVSLIETPLLLSDAGAA